MELNFTKMQAAGNDYIYLDCRAAGLPPNAAAGRGAVPTAFFRGADGVILSVPAAGGRRRRDADVHRRRQRGDHVRQRCTLCSGILYTHGVRRDCIPSTHPTPGGARCAAWARGYRQVELGHFSALGLTWAPPPWAAGRCWMCRSARAGAAGVSTAWPWATRTALFCWVMPRRGADLALYGRALGHHPAFPGGINVEFARQISPTAFAVTVWERQRATLSRDRGLRRGGLRCADRPQRTRRADFGADARRHTGSTHPKG